MQLAPTPLQLANGLLLLCHTQVKVRGREHLPTGSAVIISNHRSFLDAPVLIAGLGRSVKFACHYYLTQVPGMREVALGLGCIPLKQGSVNQLGFFRQAELALQNQQAIGVFPEGAERIARPSSASELGALQPGFVHLALRSRVDPLPIVPVGIRVQQEWKAPDMPLEFFRWFDAQEPMFQGQGGHPVVVYLEVELQIGSPLWIGKPERQLARQDRAAHIQTIVDKMHGSVQNLLLVTDQ